LNSKLDKGDYSTNEMFRLLGCYNNSNKFGHSFSIFSFSFSQVLFLDLYNIYVSFPVEADLTFSRT
jgi:hypothetical protein